MLGSFRHNGFQHDGPMDPTTCSITTRSTRSSRQISIDNTSMSQDNTAQTTARKNYTLNKTKTLKTKIEKCEKVFVDFNVTGGGITGKMVMATFELFRSACAELFNDLPPTLGRCVNHKTFDKYQKALVQQTYFVKRDVNGVEVGFTLNLYPTNNKRLLNGKDVDQFMYKHLPKIHQIMIRSPAR